MSTIEKLNIAIVQYDTKWLAVEDNLKQLDQLQIAPETNIIVLPEMFATGFCMQPSIFANKTAPLIIEWMKSFSIQQQKAVCGSVAIEENGKFYNRFYCYYLGEEIAQYDKRHLFTYSGEDKVYTAGDKRIIFDFLGWKICPQICYDLRFPVWFRNTEPYYDILLNVSNWPESRANIWKQLLKARSIENMAYMIGCNRIGKDGNSLRYTGDSKIHFPSLEKLECKKEENILYYQLEKEKLENYRKKFPFLQDQDHFKII